MALFPVAILGSKTDHGGTIISGSQISSVYGVPIARVGDIHDCPTHGKNPIVMGSPSNTDDGIPIAYIGSKTGCGAKITTGDSRFLIEPQGSSSDPNQDNDEFCALIKVTDKNTGEVMKNTPVLVTIQGENYQMKTDDKGEVRLTHSQAVTAEIRVDYHSPKQLIKHKKIHGE